MGWNPLKFAKSFTAGVSDFGGDFFKSTEKDARKRNLANEARIKSIYDNLYPSMEADNAEAGQFLAEGEGIIDRGVTASLGAITGAGAAAKRATIDQGRQTLSGVQQDLVGSGLFNSTVAPQARIAVNASVSRSLADIDAALAELRSGTIMQGAQMKAGARAQRAGNAINRSSNRLAWGSNYASTLGGIQHVGQPSKFEQLLQIGAKAAGAKIGAGL